MWQHPNCADSAHQAPCCGKTRQERALEKGRQATGGPRAGSYQVLGAGFSVVEVPAALGKAAQQHFDEALVP